MSQLSKEEVTAGISRAALTTFQKQNQPHNQPTNGNRARTLAEILSGYVCNRVIDTPMHQIDVLESAQGFVLIRNTDYGEQMRAAVTRSFWITPGPTHSPASWPGSSPAKKLTEPTKRGRG